MFNRILAFVTITVAAALTVVLPATTLTGCNQPIVPTNAIQAAEEVAQTAATVVADAEVVWPIVYATIPAAAQPAAQATFNQALFTANHAILALDDAIAAAVAANNSSPDFTAIFSQVAAAAGQVVSIVEQFMTGAVTPSVRSANGIDVVADMNTAVVRLKAAR